MSKFWLEHSFTCSLYGREPDCEKAQACLSFRCSPVNKYQNGMSWLIICYAIPPLKFNNDSLQLLIPQDKIEIKKNNLLKFTM